MHLPALKLRKRTTKTPPPPPPLLSPEVARSADPRPQLREEQSLTQIFLSLFSSPSVTSFSVSFFFPRQIKSAGLISTLRRSHELMCVLCDARVFCGGGGGGGGGDRRPMASATERVSAVRPPVRWLWAPNRRPKDGARPSAGACRGWKYTRWPTE